MKLRLAILVALAFSGFVCIPWLLPILHKWENEDSAIIKNKTRAWFGRRIPGELWYLYPSEIFYLDEHLVFCKIYRDSYHWTEWTEHGTIPILINLKNNRCTYLAAGYAVQPLYKQGNLDFQEDVPRTLNGNSWHHIEVASIEKDIKNFLEKTYKLRIIDARKFADRFYTKNFSNFSQLEIKILSYVFLDANADLQLKAAAKRSFRFLKFANRLNDEGQLFVQEPFEPGVTFSQWNKFLWETGRIPLEKGDSMIPKSRITLEYSHREYQVHPADYTYQSETGVTASLHSVSATLSVKDHGKIVWSKVLDGWPEERLPERYQTNPGQESLVIGTEHAARLKAQKALRPFLETRFAPIIPPYYDGNDRTFLRGLAYILVGAYDVGMKTLQSSYRKLPPG